MVLLMLVAMSAITVVVVGEIVMNDGWAIIRLRRATVPPRRGRGASGIRRPSAAFASAPRIDIRPLSRALIRDNVTNHRPISNSPLNGGVGGEQLNAAVPRGGH